MEQYNTLKTKLSRLCSYSTCNLMQLKIGLLDKKLDQLCTTIVILRDRKCVTCPSSYGLGNGHFIRRGIKFFRWDLDNCHCQCNICNNIHEVDDTVYRVWMINTYGIDFIEDMESKIFTYGKVDRAFRINVYENLVKEGKKYL